MFKSEMGCRFPKSLSSPNFYSTVINPFVIHFRDLLASMDLTIIPWQSAPMMCQNLTNFLITIPLRLGAFPLAITLAAIEILL